jgi:hypothetical protein
MSGNKTAFIAKYVGTVTEVEFRQSNQDKRYAYVPSLQNTHFRWGATIFETASEALAEAEKLKIRKIASLKKQIAKLEEAGITVKYLPS